MTLIWSAIEDLLRPKDSIRFGIRSRSAMILGTTDNEIKEIFRLVGELYDKRNSATHGRRFTWARGIRDIQNNIPAHQDFQALRESYQLLCDLFYCIVDKGERFSNDELSELEEQFKEKFPL
jgi:hypothetical protein